MYYIVEVGGHVLGYPPEPKEAPGVYSSSAYTYPQAVDELLENYLTIP
jgi:hypothetical protein